MIATRRGRKILIRVDVVLEDVTWYKSDLVRINIFKIHEQKMIVGVCDEQKTLWHITA